MIRYVSGNFSNCYEISNPVYVLSEMEKRLARSKTVIKSINPQWRDQILGRGQDFHSILNGCHCSASLVYRSCFKGPKHAINLM